MRDTYASHWCNVWHICITLMQCVRDDSCTCTTWLIHMRNTALLATAYCIWSVISSISNPNRRSSSLNLFCHGPSKRTNEIEIGNQREREWHSKCNTLYMRACHASRLMLCVIVLQCNSMEHIHSTIHVPNSLPRRLLTYALQHTATHCNMLQHTATHCNILQHTTTHWIYCTTLQRTVTHCNTLQHTTTYCNTLQHTATHCNTLQHTATHCNTLQHTATSLRCSTMTSNDVIQEKKRWQIFWWQHGHYWLYCHINMYIESMA